jgi:hypothetical protein
VRDLVKQDEFTIDALSSSVGVTCQKLSMVDLSMADLPELTSQTPKVGNHQ